MSVIRYKNQSDYAFLIWMRNFPDSGHPLDMQRFYSFAKTVALYRNKKYLDYSYFEGRVLNHTPHFEKESIEHFWNKLRELVEFYNTLPIPTVGPGDNSRHGIYQRGAKGNKLYEVKISELEYYSKGASKETLEKAEYF